MHTESFNSIKLSEILVVTVELTVLDSNAFRFLERSYLAFFCSWLVSLILYTFGKIVGM